MVEAIGAARAGAAVALDFGRALSGLDFLKLFTAEVQNQNPLEPLSNSELLTQVSQMANLQMVNGLSTGVGALLQQNRLLQVSGMLGKTVEFPAASGSLVRDIVSAVRVAGDGTLTLGLAGGSNINFDSVRAIL